MVAKQASTCGCDASIFPSSQNYRRDINGRSSWHAFHSRAFSLRQLLHRPQDLLYAFTAYFLSGKCMIFFFVLSVTFSRSCFVMRLLRALVCFGLRSSGLYFFFA